MKESLVSLSLKRSCPMQKWEDWKVKSAWNRAGGPLWKNVWEFLCWVCGRSVTFFQSCIQQITAVLVCRLPSLHYLFSEPAVPDCPGRSRAAKPSTYCHAPLDGDSISGIAQVSLPKLLFCLHPCFLFTPTEQLQQKDKQILLLLEEKTKIFQDMADSSVQEETPGSRLLFRANTEEAPKGEEILKTAINEGEPVMWHVNYSNQL